MYRHLATLFLLVTVPSAAGSLRADNWNAWRGPRGDGTSLEQRVPTSWNGESGENIRWRVKIPGEGHSSPIVWEDRVFLATCLPETEERALLCLDRDTGETRWQRTVLRSKLETKHTLNSHASSTPATDGDLLFIAFMKIDGHTIVAPNVGNTRPTTPGEIIVAAYDLEGEQRWETSIGEFVSAHGFCSNPVLFEDLVIINGDHDGDSYIAALGRDDGKIRWRVSRDNGIRSYTTPIIRHIGGRTQMVLSGSESVVSYDPRTGERHWMMEGPTEQFVASMVDNGELFFLTAGYPEHHIMAIRPDGNGNVTDTHIAWRTSRGAAYVPSPIVLSPYLVVVTDGGVANCFDVASGERHWTKRIGTRFSASLVAAAGKVYALSDQGEMTIIRPGSDFDEVATCPLGEPCSSSPAISDGSLFIRGHEHLYCIGEP